MLTQRLKPKKRKCKHCGNGFMSISSLQRACSLPCAVAIAKKITEKQKRELRKHALEKLKTRRDYEKEAQEAFNAYIRERDRHKGCVSCDIPSWSRKWNAGHFRPTSTHPELRFHEDNVNGQCEQCNSYLRGNIVEYRKRLIKRIGLDRVELLEGPHEPAKLSKEQLIELRDKYRVKLKALKWEKQ